MELLNPFQRLVLWGLWAVLSRLADGQTGDLLDFVRSAVYRGAREGYAVPNLMDEYLESKNEREEATESVYTDCGR